MRFPPVGHPLPLVASLPLFYCGGFFKIEDRRLRTDIRICDTVSERYRFGNVAEYSTIDRGTMRKRSLPCFFASGLALDSISSTGRTIATSRSTRSSQTACSVGHLIKRRVEAACLASVLCGACVSRWGALVASRLRRVSRRADAASAQADTLLQAARAVALAATATSTATSAAAALHEAASRLAEEAGALGTAARALRARHAGGAALAAEWEAAVRPAPCPHRLRLHHKAKTLVDRYGDGDGDGERRHRMRRTHSSTLVLADCATRGNIWCETARRAR